MFKYLRKYIFIASIMFLISSFGISEASFGVGRIDPDLVGGTLPIEVQVQSYVRFLLGFLGIISLLYALWGGFVILTAAGDDEKVKQGGKYVLYMALGLALIFIAFPLVEFIFDILLSPPATPISPPAISN